VAGKHVDVDEVLLRFASEAECDEYLREAEQMMDVLLPDRDLHLMAAQLQSCPSFVTKERLRLCWEQVVQIRELLTRSYCRPHSGDVHQYDAHPMQYAVALFHFALKTVTQYREPNPYSRRLAAHAVERLAGYVEAWVRGQEVERPAASNEALGIDPIRARSFSYGVGQRLCIWSSETDAWAEATVLRPPTATQAAPMHLLRVLSGASSHERDVDLDVQAHMCLPLYAYAVGHPLRVLSPRGAWEVCVVVDRAPRTNQFVVRMPPASKLHWVLLLPWNHASMTLHARVPLFAVRQYDALHWLPSDELGGSASRRRLFAVGSEADGSMTTDRKAPDELNDAESPNVEYARPIEFVLNFRAAARAFHSWRALWCPGVVVGVHRKPTRLSASLASVMVSKTCDVVSGSYCFDTSWTAPEQPLLVRQLFAPAALAVMTAASAASAAPSTPDAHMAFTPSSPDGYAAALFRPGSPLAHSAGFGTPGAPFDGGALSGTLGDSGLFLGEVLGESATANAAGAGAEMGTDLDEEADGDLDIEDMDTFELDELSNGLGGAHSAHRLAQMQTIAGHRWGAWERAVVVGEELELDPSWERPSGAPATTPRAEPLRLGWRNNPRIEVETQPLFVYAPGSELRLLRSGRWGTVRIVAAHTGEAAPPNTYLIGGVDGLPREPIELHVRNHAPLLDASLDLDQEHLRYSSWVRSTYAHVVDALSGERLDILLQCVKLRVDGITSDDDDADAFETLSQATFAEDFVRPIIVLGDAASGKSTFARLFLVLGILQRREPRLVPFLLTTIDLVRIIKQNSLGGDYLDGYLRSVYGPRSRRYLFLKQALLERRLVLFLDGMDEIPTGLKSVLEAYFMCYLRAHARIVMTSRPGGFSAAWLELCTRVQLLPLDAEQQDVVAKARLRQPQHLHVFKQLMMRPDLQQLATNPLVRESLGSRRMASDRV
jgi:hypothetical protein